MHAAGTTEVAPDVAQRLSFRIISSKYSSKFEIEGVGLSGGKLYFNTNRANPDGAYDGVHVFKGYVASERTPGPCLCRARQCRLLVTRWPAADGRRQPRA